MIRIADLGEFGLIGKIKSWVRKSSSVIKGIGEDCAVIEYDKKKYLLFCCDMLIEDVDFTKKTPGYLIGRKAMGSVISDIASKGGIPKYALVALGISKFKPLSFVRELYRGLDYWTKKFNIDIVGGDISRNDKVIIDISMIGYVEKENLTLRSTALPYDIIFITGRLGKKNKDLYFLPRLEEARYLVKNYHPSSMIDISDGLAQDLNHILEESNVGALIYEKLLPHVKSKIDLNQLINRGEEFELIFTLPIRKAKALIASGDKLYSAIGQIVPVKFGFKIIDAKYKEREIKIEGYRHF
ncbi:MAG: thiamine-phosphate kinase [Candidatus Omnitrophica bacterium]|nr:thiamine-phosphate kinase [Candidatus Omnitrophota bacterium]